MKLAPDRRGAKITNCLAACIYMIAALGVTAAETKETFSIDYIVTISSSHSGVARVRWELSGIEEIEWLRLSFPADRLSQFRGTGKLEPIDGGLRWVPGGPYAHLTYRVRIDHVRGQHQRYDSYAARSWIVTRAHDLFPRIAITCFPREGREPKSRARLLFRLPSGWRSAAALPVIAPDTYRLDEPGKILDRPRGWFMLGQFDADHQEIAGIMLQVARAPGSTLASKEIFRFLDGTLPTLAKLLSTTPETVLLLTAPDPMWHGGISGEHSLYMHSGRPLRTPDKTSPYLHELFHVLQPFKPSADADWIEEGLAEFYSLEIQRRAGLIDPSAYQRALAYFERFGLWNVDLTQQHDDAATNNSAPLVMYALDQRIQHATAGKKRLDDVVGQLAKEGGEVDTARFLAGVDAVSGKRFRKFFEQHVHRGVPPHLPGAS
jgi:predicted metalloprotease with PDZ domain